jgi:hypothetical protein
MRQWFKDHAADPKAEVLAQAFAEWKAAAAERPPQAVIPIRNFYRELKAALAFTGLDK